MFKVNKIFVLMTLVLVNLLPVFHGKVAFGAEQALKNKVLIVVADQNSDQDKQFHMVNRAIDEKLAEKFSPTVYNVVRDDKALSRIYAISRDDDVDSPEKVKKAYLVDFARQNGYDYVVFLTFRPTDARLNGVFEVISQRELNITLDAKVVDVRAGSYFYKGKIASSTVSGLKLLIFGNDGPIWTKAVKTCLTRFNQNCPAIPAVKS